MRETSWRAKPGADRGEYDPSQETRKLNAALKWKRNLSSSKNITQRPPISALLEASLPLKFIIQLPLCVPEHFMQNTAQTDPFTQCSVVQLLRKTSLILVQVRSIKAFHERFCWQSNPLYNGTCNYSDHFLHSLSIQLDLEIAQIIRGSKKVLQVLCWTALMEG